MCLAIPVRVVAKPNENTALIDLEGVQKEISLELVDGVQVPVRMCGSPGGSLWVIQIWPPKPTPS